MLDAIRRIDRNQLQGQDRLSYDLFVDDKQRRIAVAELSPVDTGPVGAQDGIQARLPQLAAHMPFDTEDDYRAYIERLAALPAYVDGLIEQMREAMRTGWTEPKTSVRGTPALLRELREHLVDGALGEPFRHIPALIDSKVRAELSRTGPETLQKKAAPALQRLEDFIRDDYLPAARESIAASSLPGGQPWYALLVKNATTTDLAPAEVHALGLKEVARLKAQLPAAIERTGFRGTPERFAAFAHSDPRLFYKDADALVARYKRAIERAASRLPALVSSVPAEEIVVKAVRQDGAMAAYYQAGNDDSPAALVVNTARLDARPIWEIEALALHEALPGHHLQVARAHELAALPPFRRFGWYVAFGEGWATYAESLGPEIGFYKDAFSAFGHLNEELFRAARLVVDTGIHAMGWSRQQALDYLNANTANAPLENEVEVDRYIAHPAQALGYKVGQLRIQALRDRAQAALGERFDERRFHDAVLANGALPLAILDSEIGRWIALEAAPAKASPAPAEARPKDTRDTGQE
jgi:uncharacterized protein (DUF885 family)